MIRLVDGETYVNGHGVQHTIGGPTKDYPAWVWSIQGNWYVRETGQYVGYQTTGRDDKGELTYGHVVSDNPAFCLRSIKK